MLESLAGPSRQKEQSDKEEDFITTEDEESEDSNEDSPHQGQEDPKQIPLHEKIRQELTIIAPILQAKFKEQKPLRMGEMTGIIYKHARTLENLIQDNSRFFNMDPQTQEVMGEAFKILDCSKMTNLRWVELTPSMVQGRVVICNLLNQDKFRNSFTKTFLMMWRALVHSRFSIEGVKFFRNKELYFKSPEAAPYLKKQMEQEVQDKQSRTILIH